MIRGIFITAVDIGIGKTILSAGILNLLKHQRRVGYWKPVQTGTVFGTDVRMIREITDLPERAILPSAFQFPESITPCLAAERSGKKFWWTILLVNLKSIARTMTSCW